MFEESTLEQIRERIDIVDLIQSYVPLKKSGTGMTGLCPFHKEKTPSFHVHPLKQIYHCFGCHQGGNIFTFLMNVEGLRFPEAVERLAKKAGIEIARTEKNKYVPRAKTQAPEEMRLIEAHEVTAAYYHNLLMDGRDYASVRQYVESRGISIETVKKFRIGVSPDAWSTVKDGLKKKGFTAEELTNSGLIIPSTDGKNDGYDRFRGRLMFPITNADGNTVGFGARLLPGKEGSGDKQPKYLNSPETPIFSKKNTLYALTENQRGIRLKGEAILVEGYMDVVGLYDKGVDNAMATMGTALTEEHCVRLNKITKRVVTVFDPDEAGREAWRRSISLFLDAGIVARDLKLPDQRDPDEFVQAVGAEAFYALVDKAPRQVTQLLKEISAEGPISQEQKAKWLERLTPILISSRNRSDRALLWDDVSLLLGLSPQTLVAHLDRQMGQKPPEKPQTQYRNQNPPQRPPIATFGKKDILGRAFFKVALSYPAEFIKVADQQFSQEIIEPEVAKLIQGLEVAKTPDERKKFLEIIATEVSDSELSATLSEFLMGSDEIAGEEVGAKNAGDRKDGIAFEGFAQLVKDLGRRRKEKKVAQLTTQVKLAQKLGQEDETIRLLETLTKARQEEPPIF